jgi:hypothetical protein
MIELALLALWLPGPPLVGLAVAGLVVRSVQRAPHPLRVAVGLVLLPAGRWWQRLSPCRFGSYCVVWQSLAASHWWCCAPESPDGLTVMTRPVSRRYC